MKLAKAILSFLEEQEMFQPLKGAVAAAKKAIEWKEKYPNEALSEHALQAKFKQKHPYTNNEKVVSGPHTQAEARAINKERKEKGKDTFSIWHIDGAKSGPKSVYVMTDTIDKNEDTVSHKVGLNNTHFHIRTDSNQDGQWWEVRIWRELPDGEKQEYDYKKFDSEEEAVDYTKSNYDKYESLEK
jgi:hypothetical protein